MAPNPDTDPAPDQNHRRGRTPKSTWIVIGLLALFLVACIFQGGAYGVGAWIFLVGFLLIVTALYALILHRPSWVSLTSQRQRKFALVGGGAALMLGVATSAVAGPPATQDQPTAVDRPTPAPTSPTPSADDQLSSSPSSTPSDGASSEEPAIANQPCPAVDQTWNQRDVEYRCTQDSDGQLIWLDKESAEKVVEAREAAEERAAEDRAAAEKAAAEQRAEADRKAAEQAEAERLAAEQAESERRAAEQAEAERLAAEQAEAQHLAAEQAEAERRAAEQAEADRLAAEQAEAQRLAEEQARQQQVPPAEPFMYGNCTDVKAAGAAPIHRGDYGWHAGLDADDDGIACAGD